MREILYTARVLKSEWLTLGPQVTKFESKISKVIGAGCFVVSSGTAALHCAYAAIGLKPGDEVITPPLTFVATQATAMHFGAKIVFCDVLESTGILDPNKVETLITSKTRAITVVDYAGHPGPLDELKTICEKHGIYLIEDAAHSFGSVYKGNAVGSIADLTVFSFFPTKNITTGEGGAVSSKNLVLLDKARKFGRQGMVKDPSLFENIPDGRWHQEVQSLGLNYRLSDILASIGCSQILKLKKFKKKRKKVFSYYVKHLTGLPYIKLPMTESFVDPFWHLFPLRIDRQYRHSLFEELWKHNIFVQVNYVPVYFHPIFQELGYSEGLCPIAEKYYYEEISLPMHVGLRRRELRKVVRVIKKFLIEMEQRS